MVQFRRAGQAVPHIYAHHMDVLESIYLERRLLRSGYPYDVVRAMSLPEARLKATVMGMLDG